ncbi:MAG: 2,4'-dihydroxyacetophenone dioxygenase family protein [Blastomonas sp.]
MELEKLTAPDDVKWFPLVDGIDFKLFFASEETGRWTVLLRCQPGSSFGRHRHLGAGEYFVVKGLMEYRMGKAPEGTYGYEPLDVIHDHTWFPEYTELYFTNFGAVAFLDDDDNVTSLLDQKFLRELANGG